MKIHKKYEFKAAAQSEYDWSVILDGKIREMEFGTEEEVTAGTKDYACKHQTFRMMAYKQAALRGQKVNVNLVYTEDKTTVTGTILQAVGEVDLVKGGEYKAKQAEQAKARKALVEYAKSAGLDWSKATDLEKAAIKKAFSEEGHAVPEEVEEEEEVAETATA